MDTTHIAVLLAATTGSTVVVIVVVLVIIGAGYGLYTRGGSGIEQRPQGKNTGAAGAEGPSRMSATDDETEGVINTHGTE